MLNPVPTATFGTATGLRTNDTESSRFGDDWLQFGSVVTFQSIDNATHDLPQFRLRLRFNLGWLLVGGGFRAGHVPGATDEFGYQPVAPVVNVPDFHARQPHRRQHLGVQPRGCGRGS